MFSNALFGSSPRPVLDLVDIPTYWAEMRSSELLEQAVQLIKRWKAKAFTIEAIEALQVQNARQLERLLMQGMSDLEFPDDRPQLFDRLLRGRSDIEAILRDPNHPCRVFVLSLLALTKRPLDCLDAPVFRALHPSLCSIVEWADLDRESKRRVLERFSHVLAGHECVLIVPQPSDAPLTIEQQVRAPIGLDRQALETVCIALRRWELKGNLVNYYLTLLDAIDLCTADEPEASLRGFLPDCAGYLAAAFGRVQLVDHDVSKHPAVKAKLSSAAKALKRARALPPQPINGPGQLWAFEPSQASAVLKQIAKERPRQEI